MPVDLRKVIFSNEEVQAALVNYSLRKEIKMPDAKITRIDVHWEPHLNTDMYFDSDGENGDEKVVSFSNEQLAVSLILYCKLQNDPLPKYGEKTLEPISDGVSLSIRYGWGDAPDKDHPGLALPWKGEYKAEDLNEDPNGDKAETPKEE